MNPISHAWPLLTDRRASFERGIESSARHGDEG